MGKELFLIDVACDDCGGLLHKNGKLVVSSMTQFKVIEHILATCIICGKIHIIKRIWEKCQTFKDAEVRDDHQTKI